MSSYIIFTYWVIYCALEGIYDGWVYFSMNEAVKYVRVLPIGKTFHVPHAIAFVQRAAISLVLSYCLNDYAIDIDLILIVFCLSLTLPMLQTGFYLSSRTYLSIKMKVSPPKDSKGKNYNFFSYTHKNSSIFPDYSPITRVVLFIIGVALLTLNLNGYL